MLAFWLLEISTFIFILFAFEYLASGHLFPLDLLPPALQHALFFTPFPSMLYMPIGIYMGKIAGAGIWLRPADAIALGAAGVCARAVRVAARHQEIRRVWRMTG